MPSPDPGSFKPTRAIVTGADSGIGRATAVALAQAGMDVGVTYHADETGAKDTAAEVESHGRTAVVARLDTTDLDGTARVVDQLAEQLGGLDVFVNNAGTGDNAPLLEMTIEQWRRVISMNLDSTFLACHDVLPRMIARGYGRITTVSSASVHDGLTNQSAYISAKMGVVGLTRVLARRGGPHGITANTIMPGVIATEQVLESLGAEADAVLADATENQCVPRPGQAEDVADAVAWVCSPSASFYTGQVVQIDGGENFGM